MLLCHVMERPPESLIGMIHRAQTDRMRCLIIMDYTRFSCQVIAWNWSQTVTLSFHE